MSRKGRPLDLIAHDPHLLIETCGSRGDLDEFFAHLGRQLALILVLELVFGARPKVGTSIVRVERNTGTSRMR